MPQVHKITTFSYDELSDEAKEKARASWREGQLEYDWWDFVYEDAKTIGALMGIDIDKIYFSGFCSQGDGAQFEGDYQYKKGSVKTVKEYAPKDTELHAIALELYKVQRRNFYQLCASVSHNGHYYHELCTSIDVTGNDDFRADYESEEEDLKDALRAFMQWIYSRLEAEHDHLLSDEVIEESIQANEAEFYEDGSSY